MKSKITVIGAGSVGATIAYTLSNEDIATEIVLIDINKQKAEGEVMDIIQGTCFRDPISIKSGDYEDAKDSNIVIITSGVARKPGQSRLELTQTNVDIIKSIAPNIAKAAPNALYIIVSNPVDIITYVFMKISGIPENQIIGSGTALDTARLRFGLASHFNIAQKNIHAYVFGEHGDSSFIPWSCAEVSGAKLDDYVELMHALPVDKDAMAEYVHKSGGEIIKNIITNLNITGGALGLDTSSIYAGAKDLLPYGAVLVLLTVAVMLNLKRSKYGRAIMAIRDNRIAAESVGLNVTWYKLAVFVIAAFFAGCAGVLYGHSLANIKAAAFDYNMSIEILVIVVLGGMGSVPGSVISAIVLTVLPEALREVADYRMLVYAIVLILVMQATNNPTMKRFFASAKEKLTPGRKERAAL